MEGSQSLPVKIQDERIQQRIYLMFDGAGNGTQGLAKAHRALCTELHLFFPGEKLIARQ